MFTVKAFDFVGEKRMARELFIIPVSKHTTILSKQGGPLGRCRLLCLFKCWLFFILLHQCLSTWMWACIFFCDCVCVCVCLKSLLSLFFLLTAGGCFNDRPNGKRKSKWEERISAVRRWHCWHRTFCVREAVVCEKSLSLPASGKYAQTITYFWVSLQANSKRRPLVEMICEGDNLFGMLPICRPTEIVWLKRHVFSPRNNTARVNVVNGVCLVNWDKHTFNMDWPCHQKLGG